VKSLVLTIVLALTACSPSGPDGETEIFNTWSATPIHAADVKALSKYLESKDVGDVIPLRQLLRSDTNWRKCAAEPFTVPPKASWPNMLSTLKLLRNEVIPLIGPVEALSVFRGANINTCIGGANRSQHMRFYAIDMRPTNGTTREQLIAKLCTLHARKGKALNMGLGIYKGTRFHIDTAGYRSWGHDHRAATSPCT
jgi:hypothetical protein